jgi:putative spermidine/putrescine transport system permease protein
VFLRITLPLSLPGILSGSVTIFAWTLSAFATPQLVGGGKVNMISNLVYQLGFSNFDFPFAAVLSMTALVLTVAILMALSRLMRGLERYGIQH